MSETFAVARVFLLLALTSCVPPSPRPKPPLEAPVEPGPRYARVLAVDLALGLAFVKYDGRALSMLPGCTSRGEYGFVRFEPELSTLVLTTRRELGLNLPAHAPQSLQLRASTIGRWTATAGTKPVGERCLGATHWVRSVDVGLFEASMDSRVVLSAAEQGPRSCPDSGGAPPKECAQPVRLDLVRIGEELPGDTLVISSPGVISCWREARSGGRPRDALVRTEQGCVERERAESYACDPSDEKECFEQCDRGSGVSCELLGVLVAGENRPETDRAYAARLFAQGCELGAQSACTNLAIAHRDGFGILEDPIRAKEVAERACDRGHARACAVVASVLEAEGQLEGSYSVFQRGCDAGSSLSCGRVAIRLGIGLGVARDDSLAEKFAFRACDGGDGDGCLELGHSFEFAATGRLDQNRALGFYRRACNTRSDRCRDLAIAYDSGAGIDQNQGRARDLFRRACQSWDLTSCTYLRILGDPEGEVGVPKKVASGQLEQVTRACAAGRPRACTREALMSLYDRKKAAPKLRSSCELGDPFACHVVDLLGFGRN